MIVFSVHLHMFDFMDAVRVISCVTFFLSLIDDLLMPRVEHHFYKNKKGRPRLKTNMSQQPSPGNESHSIRTVPAESRPMSCGGHDLGIEIERATHTAMECL